MGVCVASCTLRKKERAKWGEGSSHHKFPPRTKQYSGSCPLPVVPRERRGGFHKMEQDVRLPKKQSVEGLGFSAVELGTGEGNGVQPWAGPGHVGDLLLPI
jgi:hypothetical protein